MCFFLVQTSSVTGSSSSSTSISSASERSDFANLTTFLGVSATTSGSLSTEVPDEERDAGSLSVPLEEEEHDDNDDDNDEVDDLALESAELCVGV